MWCPPEAGGAGGGIARRHRRRLGALHRVDVDTGEVTKFADTARRRERLPRRAPTAGSSSPRTAASTSPRSACSTTRRRDPAHPSGIQHVRADGASTYLTPEPLQAPNDLVVAADGTVYFTDPPPYPLPTDARRPGHGAAAATARSRVVADGLFYPNGIGIEADGTRRGRRERAAAGRGDFGLVRLRADGHHERFPTAPATASASTSTGASTWPAGSTASPWSSPTGPWSRSSSSRVRGHHELLLRRPRRADPVRHRGRSPAGSGPGRTCPRRAAGRRPGPARRSVTPSWSDVASDDASWAPAVSRLNHTRVIRPRRSDPHHRGGRRARTG